MTYRVTGLIVSLVCVAAATASRSTTSRIEQVRWLTGCWELQDARRTVHEQWMAPLGNTMVSAGRTVRGDSLAEFELVVIRAGRDRLAYEPHPSDQPPAVFAEVALSDHSVRFENEAHDFPQQIGYERRGTDSLLAWIAGPINGKTKRIEFPYARVRCGNSASNATDDETSSSTTADTVLTLLDSLVAIHQAHPDLELIRRVFPPADSIVYVTGPRVERVTGDSLRRRTMAAHMSVRSMAPRALDGRAFMLDQNNAILTTTWDVDVVDTAGRHFPWRGPLLLVVSRRGERWTVRAYRE